MLRSEAQRAVVSPFTEALHKEVNMLRKNFFAHVVAGIACLGTLSPITQIQAAEPVAVSQQLALDASLHEGQLQGQFVTTQGRPLAGAQVVVSQRGTEVSRTSTNAQGQFTVALRPGLYDVTVGQDTQTVRVWSTEVAPPTAKQSVTFVQGQAVRGQFGGDNPLIPYTALGIGTAGFIVGLIAINQDDVIIQQSL